MSMRVYRLRGITGTKDKSVEGLLPVSPATIWRWVREGKFPKPFKLGAGTTVWDAVQVESFIAKQREGV
jgi:predicted DNA-binding transcriptional regulator AlpA